MRYDPGPWARTRGRSGTWRPPSAPTAQKKAPRTRVRGACVSPPAQVAQAGSAL